MKEKFDFKIITRNSEKKHFTALLENAAFIHKREQDTFDWLKWKYFGSPFGDCIVVMAYSKEGELAGEISFGKYEFLDGDKIIKAIYSYQTMVHPNFQRKGLFSSLTNKVIDIAKKQNIDVIFNFPNHNSYEPFLKLGFIPLNNLNYWVTIGSFKSFINGFSPLSLKKPFLVTKITEYDEQTLRLFNELSNTIKPESINSILYPNRTVEFIRWRFFTFPMHLYKIIQTELGWVIVRVGYRGNIPEAQIMEVFPTKKLNSIFLKTITKQIREELKVGIIVFNMSNTHPLNKEMVICGFFNLPNKLKFCVFPLNKTGNQYLNKTNWIITATEFHRY